MTTPDPAYLDEVFGRGGYLAREFQNYQPRRGQIAIARVLDKAMREGTHSICEGPTGTGKSLGYSVPSVAHAALGKKRVVIATANIALQEQLTKKDLPLLQRVLPWPFRFSLFKGRSHYLCQRRLAKPPPQTGFEAAGFSDLPEVLRWARTTATGDVSELGFVPSPETWRQVSVAPGQCAGKQCKQRASCFSEKRSADAAKAHVVVTNFHVLFAHLALRQQTGKDVVLPPFDIVVMDEAHEAADIARSFFGFSVTHGAISGMVKAVAHLGDRRLAQALERAGADAFAAARAYARSAAYDARLKQPGFVDLNPLIDALASVERLGQRHGDAAPTPELQKRAKTLAARAKNRARQLAELWAQEDANKVYWLEDDGDQVSCHASFVDVSAILRTELFARCSSVNLLSATVSVGGSFGFIRRETGLPKDSLETVVESPYDWRRNALLIVPDGAPDPSEPDYRERLGALVADVVERAQGRTLGLFTSFRSLEAAAAALTNCRYPVLRQGEGSRTALVDKFRADETSVLLGTTSFWTGVDVPGRSLSAVVIDKLPFPNPKDALVDAITERDGSKAFHQYTLPRAIMQLRQGVGRILRAVADVGVVVLLDPRLTHKRYRHRVLKSLPPMPRSRSLDDLAPFLRRGPGNGAAAA